MPSNSGSLFPVHWRVLPEWYILKLLLTASALCFSILRSLFYLFIRLYDDHSISNAVMILKLLAVVHIFIFLASAKECTPGQNCGLKCCTTPKGDVLCRARCLGLSCELDVHCDGDCCVNSKCTSCLFKRLVLSCALKKTRKFPAMPNFHVASFTRAPVCSHLRSKHA